MPETIIIIVNWNGVNYLKPCIDSVLSQTYKDFILLFVDNNSSDNSLDFMKKNYIKEIKSKKIIIIKNKENYGFAEGNNIGIRYAMKFKDLKYIVLLNNDTIVDKNWLKELIETAKDDAVGMVSSKTYFMDKKNIDTLGIKIDFLGISRDIKDERKINKLLCPSGVSALYKRNLLEEIKYKDEYFDKDFFMYCEDVDLGLRAKYVGWEPAYSKKSIVYHIHGGSSKNSKLPICCSQRNNIWVIVKNYRLWYLLLVSPLIFLLHLSVIIYNIPKGNGFIILKAKIQSIKEIKKIIKKRYF